MKVTAYVSRLLSAAYPALVLTVSLIAWSSTTLLLSGEVQPDGGRPGLTQDRSKNLSGFENLQAQEKNHQSPLTS